MAIFKPIEKPQFDNSKFSGICKFAIVGFEDKSSLFDWADVFIEVEVKQEFSDYTRKLSIKGSFEKDGNGLVTGGSVLKRIYNFFEAIGCTAGINVAGNWEKEDGDKIEDIAQYLERFSENPMPDTDIENYPYIAYFYKEMPKKPGAKSYTSVWPKVYTSSEENKKKLQSDIDWLKGKGFLKELTDEVVNAPAMSGNSLSNL